MSGSGAPPFLGGDVNDHEPQAGGFLSRGGSGFFAMGYSSQFDVEAQVGHVNAFLEKDVDFDGWLKDLPDEDEGE